MNAKVVFTCDVCGRNEQAVLRLDTYWVGDPAEPEDVPIFDEPPGWDIDVDRDPEKSTVRCPDHRSST